MAHSRAGKQGLVQWPRSQPPTPPDTRTHTHTCGWGLVRQSRDLADEGQGRGAGGPPSWPLVLWLLLQQLFSGHPASPGAQCRAGALEGTAALPGEEHPALLNGRLGQRHPNLWVCRQALLGVSRPHSVTPVLGVQLMASCHQFFLLTSFSPQQPQAL